MRTRFLLVVLVLAGASCGGNAVLYEEAPHETGDRDASTVADATDAPDASVHPDAADGADTSVHPDATDASDTSVPFDAADASDASVHPDVTDAPSELPVWDHQTPCPVGVGPTMALLPAGFCIDSTEVTKGQYHAWLQTNPSLAGQHERCSQWNDSFVPFDLCEQTYSFGCTEDDCPQRCIDWCDAYAFCKAMSKHLCGRMGGGGLATPWGEWGEPHDAIDPSLSQWYHACSANGQNTYPYGDTYNKAACNGESTTVTHLPVGSKPACQSSTPGYEGVFDLSGNVAEWEDNCVKAPNDDGVDHDGSDDDCALRGGFAAVALEPEGYACEAVWTGRRATPDLHGFRCCYP